MYPGRASSCPSAFFFFFLSSVLERVVDLKDKIGRTKPFFFFYSPLFSGTLYNHPAEIASAGEEER